MGEWYQETIFHEYLDIFCKLGTFEQRALVSNLWVVRETKKKKSFSKMSKMRVQITSGEKGLSSFETRKITDAAEE